MKNIHVLPTLQPSRLWKNNLLQGILVLNEDALLFNTAQNIYITSNKEIKDSEIDTKVCIFKSDKGMITCLSGKGYGRVKTIGKYYEVILTTDVDLIANGVQAIDDEFLEWFVKNPSCEEVKTNYIQEPCLNCEWNYDSCPNSEECLKSKYKIIIPKEEPKFEDSIENSINIMSIANSMFSKKEEPKQEFPQFGTKEFNDLASTYFGGKPKQETLEDAAEKWFKEIGGEASFMKAIEFGIKWQQEQNKNKYSEEEVYNIIEQSLNNYHLKTNKGYLKQWFEKFKKK
jgi:hypothetical protein